MMGSVPMTANIIDPDDEFYTGCVAECPDDCMSDHRGEE